MDSLLGVVEIFYICLGGLFGFLFYTRYHLGVGVYVLMGIILGPQVLNCVSISYLSNTLSSIGLLFVLFEIGLHLSYEKILILKHYLLSSSLSIIFSIITVTTGVFFLKSAGNIYLLIGMLLCISSTPIIYHLLQEKNKLYTKTGRFVFTVMLLQDILSIFLLINNTNNNTMLWTLAKTAVVLLVLFVVGKKVIKNIFKKFSCSFEFILLISFLTIIGLSLLTEYMGLSLELGAVLAGFLMAETDYSSYIESQIVPIKQVLLCVFFMTMGMHFPLLFLYKNFIYCLLLFVGAIFLKFIGLFLGARLFLLNNLQSVTGAVMLLSVGEVVFIFINKILPRWSSTIPPNLLNYLSIVTVLSLLITPLLFHFFYYLYHTQVDKNLGEKKQFIVIGFNDATEIVIKIFQKNQINYLCLDNNVKIISENKDKGYNIFLVNYTDTKTISKIISSSTGVFFSYAPPLSLLQQIQSYTREKIYIKIKDQQEEQYYNELGFSPIRISKYDEAFKICTHILSSFGIDEIELEKMFLNL